MVEISPEEEMQWQILRLLYEDRFLRSEGCHGNLIRFASDKGYDQQAVRDAFDGLAEAGLAEHFAIGGAVRITTAGILHAEDNGLADPDVIARQRGVRTRLMDGLYGLREERGRGVRLDWVTVTDAADVTKEDFSANHSFLADAGLLKTGGPMRVLEISEEGRRVVENYRRRRGAADEFEVLKEQRNMTPQERGRRFEGVLGTVIAEDGWAVERNVAIQGEQNDLIVYRDNDCYLVEAKWMKAPVSPDKVSRLSHKVSKRPGMKGILISMSGFTKGAKKDARDLLMQDRLVLLFGPGDIEAMVAGGRSFTAALAEKTRAAMTRREILVA